MSATAAQRATGSDILAIGFGTTVAMWIVGYIGRVPPAMLPNAALLLLLLACMAAGGWFAGRYSARGWKGGLYAGLLSAVLNLLVLGSVLSGSDPNRVVPSALWWIPGSILLAMILGAAGAWAGARHPSDRMPDWTAILARVAAVATFFLIVIGGLVTSHQAGLAVVDWPSSFGYNMFLYPLSRMVGGVFYEHAHRLFGSLVGLTTIVLAIHLLRADRRRWLRGLSLTAVALVIAQGIFGGLRVTGRFTTSQSPLETSPNLTLALVHGVVGQTFFALMVAIAAFSSRTWKGGAPAVMIPSARTDRAFSALLVALLLLQLVLGAVQRHFRGWLHLHITIAAAVLVLALLASARAVRLTGNGSAALLRRIGLAVMALVTLQVLLGLGALAILLLPPPAGSPTGLSVAVRTAHQSVGAMLLASAVLLAVWGRRLLRAASREE